MTGTALIAIGGNALVLDGEPGSIPRQQERAAVFAEQVAELVAADWTVVVSHGNGPQVGFILRRGELVASHASVEGLPELPLWLAVADSQGGIGHIIAMAIDNAMSWRRLSARAAVLISHAEVDPDDPEFASPTKPIGSRMTAEVAHRRARDEGWVVRETAPGIFRRVVPSPQPKSILEVDHVLALIAAGAVVVAAGGGGIPVVRDDTSWRSVDAVIDKDRASAVLAATVGVDVLMLVTGVDQVSVAYGTPAERPLSSIGAEEARRYLDAGEFPAGSMGPKIEAALQFLEAGGREAVITSLPRLQEALAGGAGTHITRGREGGDASKGRPHDSRHQIG
jgi:carbamate kinase